MSKTFTYALLVIAVYILIVVTGGKGVSVSTEQVEINAGTLAGEMENSTANALNDYKATHTS